MTTYNFFDLAKLDSDSILQNICHYVPTRERRASVQPGAGPQWKTIACLPDTLRTKVLACVLPHIHAVQAIGTEYHGIPESITAQVAAYRADALRDLFEDTTSHVGTLVRDNPLLNAQDVSVAEARIFGRAMDLPTLEEMVSQSVRGSSGKIRNYVQGSIEQAATLRHDHPTRSTHAEAVPVAPTSRPNPALAKIERTTIGNAMMLSALLRCVGVSVGALGLIDGYRRISTAERPSGPTQDSKSSSRVIGGAELLLGSTLVAVSCFAYRRK
jgi:hypothetical protein